MSASTRSGSSRVRRSFAGTASSNGATPWESSSDATAWVDGVDEPNAAVVSPRRARGDLVVQLTTRLCDSDPGLTTSPYNDAPTTEPVATTHLGKEN